MSHDTLMKGMKKIRGNSISNRILLRRGEKIMDKKAQENIGIGIIMVMFITVLVGVIFFQAIAEQAALSSTTGTYNTTAGSDTITIPADTVILDLFGQELLDTPIVRNASNDIVGSGNYTIDEGVSTSTGVKTIRYTAVGSEYAAQTANITYSYGVDGYVDNSGSRAIISLIAIFFALAVAVVALSPTLRSNVLKMVNK